MILTCPKCATRFFADEKAIGTAGRRVKCDACGEIWSSAGADDAADLSSPTAPEEDAVTGVERAGATETPLFVERVSAMRNTVRRPSRAPLVVGLVFVAIAIVAMFVFQRQIERTFPGASTVYRSVGLGSLSRAGG